MIYSHNSGRPTQHQINLSIVWYLGKPIKTNIIMRRGLENIKPTQSQIGTDKEFENKLRGPNQSSLVDLYIYKLSSKFKQPTIHLEVTPLTNVLNSRKKIIPPELSTR